MKIHAIIKLMFYTCFDKEAKLSFLYLKGICTLLGPLFFTNKVNVANFYKKQF